MTSEPDEYEALWDDLMRAHARREYVPAILRDHVEAKLADLTEKLEIATGLVDCACGYDNATDVCLGHQRIVEAKLAEVRAVDQHFIDQCELKAHNATVALADRDRTIAELQRKLDAADATVVMLNSNIEQDSRTIAEQAAELGRKDSALEAAIVRLARVSCGAADATMLNSLKAALGGSNAK